MQLGEKPMFGSIKVGRVVRQARANSGLTLANVADQIGCSKSHLSLMESGHRAFSPEMMAKIEDALGITDGSLVSALEWENTPRPVQERVESHLAATKALAERLRQAAERGESLDLLYKSGQLADLVEQADGSSGLSKGPVVLRRVPIINKVSAGYPREFTDLDYPASVADDYLSCPEVTDPTAFAARVVGDSMAPHYSEGDIVVFSPERPLPDRGSCDCFVRLARNDETTFKRVLIEDDGAKIRLRPINPRYRDRLLDREEVTGLWPAVYVVRPVRHDDPHGAWLGG
jgi:repressor LexA